MPAMITRRSPYSPSSSLMIGPRPGNAGTTSRSTRAWWCRRNYSGIRCALRGLEVDCGYFGSSTPGEAPSLSVDVARDVGLQLAYTPEAKFALDSRLRRGEAGLAAVTAGFSQRTRRFNPTGVRVLVRVV